ncbi:MAG: DNA polymerase III subunit chi [Magnetococcales bacterium]|nr:DNA polymerase III subunit chi [Magnetococcales bacterium]
MARTHPEPPTVRFYQLAAMPLETALVGLLGKAWERGMRINLVVKDGQQAQRLDDFLWIHPPNQFLPHGLWSGPDPELQPVLISLEPDARNGATVLMVATPLLIADPTAFDLVIDFLPSQHPDALAAGRNRYRHYRALGCQMEYWIQTPQGGWKRQGEG